MPRDQVNLMVRNDCVCALPWASRASRIEFHAMSEPVNPMRLSFVRTGLWVRCFAVFCVWLSLAVIAGPIAADEALPEREAVEARLGELRPEEGASLSGVEQRDMEALKATLDTLERLEGVEEQRETLERRLDEAPAELLRLERELLEEEEETLERTVAALDDLTLEELEYHQQEAVLELQQLQDRLAEVNSRLLAAHTLPERAQHAIAEAMQEAERTRRELDVLDRKSVV